MHKNEVRLLEEVLSNYKYECSKINSNLEHYKRKSQELGNELTAFHIKEGDPNYQINEENNSLKEMVAHWIQHSTTLEG